jgi:hypothetical protein
MTEQTGAPGGNEPAKLVRFHCLADLIREAYGIKRRRLAVSKADLLVMRSAPNIHDAQRDELLRLAASDRMLDRTRELLLFSAERFANQSPADAVRAFVGGVLRLHPAFRELRGVVDSLPESMDDEAAVETLAAQPFPALPWPEGLPPLKKSEAEQLRVNALCCLLLWLRETRGTSMERIRHYLHAAAWAPAARRQTTDASALRVLMQARDRTALGVACSGFEMRVRELSRDAATARGKEERAAARAMDLQAKLEETSRSLAAEKIHLQSLTAEMEKTQREHEDEKAHMRNQYEELRGRLLRRLRQEVSLLDEGLQALKRVPPKVHVMEDHAERAIQGLRGEIDRIRGD